jgi:hypothetical protein
MIYHKFYLLLADGATVALPFSSFLLFFQGDAVQPDVAAILPLLGIPLLLTLLPNTFLVSLIVIFSPLSDSLPDSTLIALATFPATGNAIEIAILTQA